MVTAVANMLSGASGNAVQAMPESDDAQAQSEEVSDISEEDEESRMDIHRPLVCHGRGGSRVMGATRVPEALQMAVFDIVIAFGFCQSRMWLKYARGVCKENSKSHSH